MGKKSRAKVERRNTETAAAPLYFMQDAADADGERVYQFQMNEEHPLHLFVAEIGDRHELSGSARAVLTVVMLSLDQDTVGEEALKALAGMRDRELYAAALEELVTSGILVRSDGALKFNIVLLNGDRAFPSQARQ